MAISVRPATPSDYHSILPLAAALHDDHVVAHPGLFRAGVTAVPEARFDSLLGSPYCEVLVAEEEGQDGIAGYAIMMIPAATIAERVLSRISRRLPPRRTEPLLRTLRRLTHTPANEIVLRRRVAFLDSIYVAKEHRGHGVGRRLIQGWVDWAKAQSVECLRLDVYEFNRGAIDLYESLGLRTEKRTMVKSFTDQDCTEYYRG